MNQKLPPNASRAAVSAMNEQAHVVIARQASRDPAPVAKRRTLSCGCLTYRMGPDGPEVLLVKPWPNKHTWGVPKGHIHTGDDCEPDTRAETPAECAARETLEETGIEVTVQVELPSTRTESYDEDKTVRVFLAVPSNNDGSAVHPADGENIAVRWHHIDHLPPLHAYQASVVAAGLPMIRQRLASSTA